MKPIVAIVGRPNVGKSTLFNRITSSREALVDNLPGVTRDRHYKDAVWNDQTFVLIDTGGFISGDKDNFAAHIRFQVEQAVAEADAVVLVLDGRSGVSPFDRDIIDWLRQCDQPIFYVVNKVDGPEHEDRLYEFYNLGLERLFSLSAEHGYGVADFLDRLVSALPQSHTGPAPDQIRVTLVGRPNVGKSSLINKLTNQERVVVSDAPGTTRDAVDSVCSRGNRVYRLIDTAGIRRKARVERKLEKFSIIKALKSLERCDVALIVLDASQGVTDQDIKVAGYANDRGCGAIWAVNKWDLIGKEKASVRSFEQDLRQSARYMAYAPVLTISALTGLRVNRLFGLVNTVYDQYVSRISTGKINRIINEAVEQNEPSLHKGRRIKFYYTTQVGVSPPTFVSFVNYPQAIHFSYHRYLMNQIRRRTGLTEVPLRLFFRQRNSRPGPKKKKQKN